MAKSQLKRLKESLRSAGVTGQQKPKKAKNRRQQSDSRVDKNVALQSIREEFNPFEIKTTKEKHSIIGQKKIKGKEGRPGLSKQIGEENRKRTLLVEMQRRNKAGGIIDRRFGENDPTLTPEERMLERFAKEKQKRVRGGDIFNLEDDDDLTHLGQSLGRLKDDFDGGEAMEEDSDDGNGPSLAFRKRLLEAEEGEDEEEEQPRKKSKAEVMKEVISKSKFHKYERQKAKEDDEEEREKLDAEMGSLWALLGQKQPSTTGPGGQDVTGTNSEPLGVRGSAAKEAEKEAEAGKNDEYDKAVREMMFDARSKPSDRTKTEEERAAEESERLKKLEDERQRRMRGEDVSDDESKEVDNPDTIDDEDYMGDHAAYGFGEGIQPATVNPKYADMNPDELVDGDYEVSEDGYVDVDEEGIVEGNISDDYDSDASSIAGSESGDDSDEEGFLAELLPGTKDGKSTTTTGDKLAFTFPCPQTHEDFLKVTENIPVEDLPTVVQRIRVLHHPKLAEENKAKLANFSTVLLTHILHLANTSSNPPFPVLDTLIRHLHALAKSYPIIVSQSIREHLTELHSSRLSNPTSGDLVLLTAISAIFPTSDHFHQVVTPALIIIHQHLSQSTPTTHQELALGAYLATLSIRYQALAKRFSPEALNYIYQALCLLSPSPPADLPGTFPYHARDDLRIPKSEFKAARKSASQSTEKLKFRDIFSSTSPFTLFTTFTALLTQLSDLLADLPSFPELFTPAVLLLAPLSKHTAHSLATKVNTHLSTRPPLQLHHHRPLPIPSNYPKFDVDYNPERHSGATDPDPDRREAAKLKAEIKREKKGAVRELRKDAAFLSREKMKKDKAESRAYHEKMRKIIARVQTEEGTEGNKWEREKRAMKRK